MDFVRTTGAGGLRAFAKIRLPHALPDIFTGLKVGAAMSATAAVVAEFVASDRGLGYLLLQYNGDLNTQMVFATVDGAGRHRARRSTSRSNCWNASPFRGTCRRHAPARTNAGHHLNNDNRGKCHEHRIARSDRLAAHRWRLPAWAEDAVSLRLNWYLGGVHAPFYLGKERGFYRDAGIDLTINEGRGSANTVQVVAAGTDTFGLADSSSVMRLRVEGCAGIRTVMSLLNTSGFGVISLAETGIKTPKDLEGKKLAITAGDALTQLFPAVRRLQQARHRQDHAGADRSRRQGRRGAGEARRRAAGRARRSVLPDQAEGLQSGRHGASPRTAPTPSA